MRSADSARKTSGFDLAMLCSISVIQLVVLAVASLGFEEVADVSPFGRTGTVIVVVTAALVACLGAVVGWRGAGKALRAGTATALAVAVGLLALMTMAFLIAGGTTFILTMLLALATFCVAMIGRAVLHSTSKDSR